MIYGAWWLPTSIYSTFTVNSLRRMRILGFPTPWPPSRFGVQCELPSITSRISSCRPKSCTVYSFRRGWEYTLLPTRGTTEYCTPTTWTLRIL